MTVYLVGAGPGDPGLLTVRGAELLAAAAVVVHDRLIDRRVLDLAVGAERIDVGKRPGAPRRQEEINELLIHHGRSGKLVVRLKGGDPLCFGRGGEEAIALAGAGVPFEIVPGVTSAFAAPAYAGVPVTHRGLSTSVTVVTGHVGDSTSPGGVDWRSLARAGGTLVVLMGMANRREIAAALIEGGRPAHTPVAVIEWGTTAFQRTVRTTLDRLSEVDLGSPATIVVGAVAGLDLDWFEHRPLHGWTVVVTRPRAGAQQLITELEAAGASTVAFPVIETVDPADGGTALRAAVEQIASFEWVVLTSAVAVRRVLALVDDRRQLNDVRLAVVGRATAAALVDHHLVADCTAPGETASSLVAVMPLPAGGRHSGRVLFPRAAEARAELARGLRGRGWDVIEVEAYRTVGVAADDAVVVAALPAVGMADAVIFTSPSTVLNYLRLVGGQAGSLPPGPSRAICIGPTTAAAAQEAGLQVAAVAQDRSAAGLVQAVVDVRLRDTVS